MISNREKCRHMIEFVMSSRVCKKCGLIEGYKSSVYSEKREEKPDIKVIA